MTQKEREVASKYGIMKSQNNINQERSTSHEHMIIQEARKKQEIVKQAIKNGYATQADKYKSL